MTYLLRSSLIFMLLLAASLEAQYCGYYDEEYNLAPCSEEPYRYDCSQYNSTSEFSCNEKYGCCWWGGFSFGGEFLYWKPCVDDLDYAISLESADTSGTNITNNGSYQFNKPDWEPGLRLHAGMDSAWYDWDFTFDYTYVNGSRFDSITAESDGLVLSTLFHGGFGFDADSISGSYKFRYQTIEGVIAHDFILKPRNTFTTFLGLQWLDLSQRRESTISDSTTTDSADLHWRGDYWGLGFRFGTKYTYDICQWLQCFASGSASILAGEAEVWSHHKTSLTTTGGVNLRFKTTECLVVPGYQAAFGLNLKKCWCSMEWDLHFGYELLKWHNIPTTRRYFNSGADIGLSTSQSGATFGFHGLFAGTGFSF